MNGRARTRPRGRAHPPATYQPAVPRAWGPHPQPVISGAPAAYLQHVSTETHPQLAVPDAPTTHTQYATPEVLAAQPQPAASGALATHPQYAASGVLVESPQRGESETLAAHPQYAASGALAEYSQPAAFEALGAGPQYVAHGVLAAHPQHPQHPQPVPYSQYAAPGALAVHPQPTLYTQYAAPGTLATHPQPMLYTQYAAPGALAAHPQPFLYTQYAAPGALAAHPQPTLYTQYAAPGALAAHPQPPIYTHYAASGTLAPHPQPAASGAWRSPGVVATTRQPRQRPWQSRYQSLRGRREVVQTGQPSGTEVTTPQLLGQSQLSARLQTISLSGRRGRGRIFGDPMMTPWQNLQHMKMSKIGSEGKTVRLFTNHFQMRSHPQTIAYKYNVYYQPEEGEGLLQEHLILELEDLFGDHQIFDGSSLLLPHKLDRDMTVSSRFSNQMYVITIEFVKELQPSDPDLPCFYNILLKRILKKMNMTQLGRNHYRSDKKIDLNANNVEAWCGYATSVLQYENSITLCADVAHKLIRLETAWDVISKVVEGTKEATDSTDRQKQTEKELVGSIVFTTYNNRTYRVDAINWKENPTSKFTTSSGTLISYNDYCNERYKVKATDLNQPLLMSKGRWKKSHQGTPNEPIQLIPQLCKMTGLSEELRKDSVFMREFTEKTRLTPEKRRCELQEFSDVILKNEITQVELQRWNVNFEPNFLSLSGRVLKEVTISQKSVKFVPHWQYADWSKEVRTAHLITAKSLHHWLLVYPMGNRFEAKSLQDNLREVTPTMNITVREAKMVEVNVALESYVSVIEKNIESMQMVVCVLPNDNKEVYDGIKKYLCVKCPIPSQCVVLETLLKRQVEKTIATKIAQQMNCKMGGALWKVDTGLESAMFVGIDCFHDIVNRRKSIAAFVSSGNKDLTQWFSQCVFQETGEELVSGLETCLHDALNFWYKYNLSMPTSIIVYRDGVGDTQLQALLDHEIPQFETALQELFKPLTFKLTFIVVKKRINTRFFIESRGKFENPPPGTVIDVELTKREWYDFFIVSQYVKEGTVTPTHYNVVYDTVNFTPDEIQCLTYKLCHMYYNMSGIMRVPAPCHYAHKLAYLVGQSIHQQPHVSLKDRLFYL